MRAYKDWGVCSFEEHKLLVLANRICRERHKAKNERYKPAVCYSAAI